MTCGPIRLPDGAISRAGAGEAPDLVRVLRTAHRATVPHSRDRRVVVVSTQVSGGDLFARVDLEPYRGRVLYLVPANVDYSVYVTPAREVPPAGSLEHVDFDYGAPVRSTGEGLRYEVDPREDGELIIVASSQIAVYYYVEPRA